MTITLHPASQFPLQDLAEVLNLCYEDYATPIRFNPRQLDFFIRAHDIALDASVVARARHGLVGVVLLGRRGTRGWVAGLGVKPSYRGQGLARRLMEELMVQAASRELTRLQLEVLSTNSRAQKLYKDLGWRVERELLVWERAGYEGPLPIHRERAREMDPMPLLEDVFDAWHPVRPCWQREKETLLHYAQGGMQAWGVVRAGKPVAYVMGFAPQHGRMPLLDVAVDPQVGYRSAGRAMIQNLHLMFNATVQLPNEPVASELNFLFTAMGYRVVLRQYEMIFDISNIRSGVL